VLRFSTPQNLGASLRETYEHLLPQLSCLLGYPAELQSFRLALCPEADSLHEDTGHLLIRLAGPGGEVGRNFLRLTPQCSDDPFARRIAGGFVALSRRLAESAKQSWDLKAFLIREGAFLWDNTVLSCFYRGNQKYVALEVLTTARDTLLFRYEGEPVALGVLVTWNWHQLEPHLREQGCSILDLSRGVDLRSVLREIKAMHLLSDGGNSIFVMRSVGKVGHLVHFPHSGLYGEQPEYESVPARFRHLPRLLKGRDLGLVTTRRGELYLFRSGCVLKWTRAGWYRVSGPPLRMEFETHLPAQVADCVSKLITYLSDHRVGSLILVPDVPVDLQAHTSGGVKGLFRGTDLGNILEMRFASLAGFAAIDGALIIAQDGAVLGPRCGSNSSSPVGTY